jgi:tetratricopeptide (TPR) repeat protein
MNYQVILKNSVLLMILFSLFSIQAQSQNERRFIRRGTSLYQDSNFLDSEIEYRKALEKKDKSFEARFNLADALFKQEKIDDALEQFQSITSQSKDKALLSDIYHNIGNGFFAKQELDKSIEAYKEALRNDPLDDETRYNLIAAQKMKQKQEQEKEKQDQDQKDNKEDQKKEDQKKDEQKQQEQQQKEQEQKDQQQQQQQQSQDELSKENAQRILNSIEQDEKELQEKLRKVKASQSNKIEKNW